MNPKRLHPEGDQSARWIGSIMAAVAAWGAIQAIGAWTLNHDYRRPLVVFGCMLAFLGFWLAMLSLRSARMRKR